jgi:hypothetical protein
MAHYTVGQLQRLHAERFGPTKSRNRPYLLRKLGLDKPQPPRTYEDSKALIASLAGTAPLRTITAKLAEGGYPTASGSTNWWPSSVQSVLRSRATGQAG